MEIKSAEAKAAKIRIEAEAEVRFYNGIERQRFMVAMIGSDWSITHACAAQADAKHMAGQGLSRQRQAIVDGLQQSVLLFQKGVPTAGRYPLLGLFGDGFRFETQSRKRKEMMSRNHTIIGRGDLRKFTCRSLISLSSLMSGSLVSLWQCGM